MVALTPPATFGAFRTAEELSSSESVQLRRTIEELEARVSEQDIIIDQQYRYILDLESRQGRRDGSKHEPVDQTQELEAMRSILESLEEQFKSFMVDRVNSLNGLLTQMDSLPNRPEIQVTYNRIKSAGRQIQNGRLRGAISPLEAIAGLTQLEQDALAVLGNKPTITYSRVDQYRAEVLVEYLDRTNKPISTKDAITILTEAEKTPMARTQAIRAMRWAVTFHADKIKLVKHGSKQKISICKAVTGGQR
jgi:hypothetical protein